MLYVPTFIVAGAAARAAVNELPATSSRAMAAIHRFLFMAVLFLDVVETAFGGVNFTLFGQLFDHFAGFVLVDARCRGDVAGRMAPFSASTFRIFSSMVYDLWVYNK